MRRELVFSLSNQTVSHIRGIIWIKELRSSELNESKTKTNVAAAKR